MLAFLLNSGELFTYIAMPLLIFCARIVDVSISTVRVIFVSKGIRNIAPILGFFEVLIWLLAIGQIFQNLDNWLCYVAYAGGFATGTYIGMGIENRLAVGNVILRIITPDINVAEVLIKSGYICTTFEGQGTTEKAYLIFMVIKRKKIKEVAQIIQQVNPDAFYTIEDIRFVNSGLINAESPPQNYWTQHYKRKGK